MYLTTSQDLEETAKAKLCRKVFGMPEDWEGDSPDTANLVWLFAHWLKETVGDEGLNISWKMDIVDAAVLIQKELIAGSGRISRSPGIPDVQYSAEDAEILCTKAGA